MLFSFAILQTPFPHCSKNFLNFYFSELQILYIYYEDKVVIFSMSPYKNLDITNLEFLATFLWITFRRLDVVSNNAQGGSKLVKSAIINWKLMIFTNTS